MCRGKLRGVICVGQVRERNDCGIQQKYDIIHRLRLSDWRVKEQCAHVASC